MVPDLGRQSHFDLDFGADSAYDMPYAPKYTLDGTEIMFEPATADARGLGVYWFYPVEEGPVRRIAVEGGNSALLTSSGEGYFVDQPEDLKPNERRSVWRVTRRRFEAATGATADVWQRRLDLRSFGGDLSLSEDGRWLGVHGWRFEVLNTASGGTVFSYPTVGNLKERVARLGSVVGEAASGADLGTLGNIRFMGDKLLFFRQFGSAERANCFAQSGAQYDAIRIRKCLRENRLSGRSRAVYDVYDMNGIAPDAQPAYRADVYLETSCMEGNLPFRGLQDVDGELAYLHDAVI